MDIGSLASATGAEWIGWAPHEELRPKARPVCPRRTCCTAAARFPARAPATVLRSRDVELAFLGLIPQRIIATQLLYRTADMKGQPDATVTTVIVPKGVTPGRPCPLLSYQCAIDAVASRCFPSYALRRRARPSARWRSWNSC